MVVPNRIKEMLFSGENVIYERSGGFQFDGKSIVGTHTLCMTSQGRILIHDTGGLFGSDTAHALSTNPSKIRIASFTNNFINVSGTVSYPFSFDFTISVEEFEKWLNHIPSECFYYSFSEESASDIPAYVSYDHGAKSYMTMGIKANQLELLPGSGYPRTGQAVPFSRIRNIESVGDYSVLINGYFDIEDKRVSSIKLFTPAKGKLLALVKLQAITPKLSELTGDFQAVYPILFSGTVNGNRLDGQEMTLVHKIDGVVAIVDELRWSILLKLHTRDDQWYYRKEGNRILALQQGIPYVIDMERADVISYAEKTWVNVNRIWHNCHGSIYGTYGGAAYKGEEVVLLIDKPKHIQLVLWESMKLVPIVTRNEPEVIESGNRMLLLQGPEIAMVVWPDTSWVSGFEQGAVSKAEGRKIGYSAQDQPFYYEQSEQGIIFNQRANENLHTFGNQAITDMSIAEKVEDASDFVSVAIRVSGEKADSLFYLPVQEVPGLIFRTYQQSKAPLVKRTPPAQLYLSWTRQVNDFALYHLFGQMFALQAGIGQIQESIQNRDECNHRLLNFLYYAIQNQKRRLDQVSIYLPAMLEDNSRRILEGAGFEHHEEPYRQLQNGFMSISAKMKQSLAEIESTLSGVYSLIIPKGDMEKIISGRVKRGYGKAMITAGIGTALVVGTAGLGLGAALLLGGTFLGGETYYKANDDRKKREMDAAFDHDRLDFYMTKALDHFDHLMQALIPFYVAEANRYMMASFQRIAPVYKSALLNPNVMDDLFREISQYYTFKQLPVDDSVVMPKKTLVEYVHASTSKTDQFIQLFQDEVTYDVSEQVKKPRLNRG